MNIEQPTQSLDLQQFRQYLEQLSVQAHPEQGFFGPDSLAWRLSREPALKLAGMPALLMQIAHPKVAQGVADHSRFHDGPLKRVVRTFVPVHTIMFGTRDDAIRAALSMRGVHGRVRGKIPADHDQDQPERYNAHDPELVFWVAATLLDLSVSAYELFHRELNAEEKERFYQEGKVFGRLCGVPAQSYPDTWEEFQVWFANKTGDGTLQVTPAAMDICRNLLWGTWTTRLLAPLNYTMSAMLLPDPVRRAYGFRKTLAVRAGYRVTVALVRLLVRAVPRRWRAVPLARRRERELGAA